MKRRHVKKMVRRGWCCATWRQRELILHAERVLSRRDGSVSLWLYFAARGIEMSRAFERIQRILRGALAA